MERQNIDYLKYIVPHSVYGQNVFLSFATEEDLKLDFFNEKRPITDFSLVNFADNIVYKANYKNFRYLDLNEHGEINANLTTSHKDSYSICSIFPKMTLSVSQIEKDFSKFPKGFISPDGFINFGEYIQNYVGNKKQKQIEKAIKNNEVNPTGRIFEIDNDHKIVKIVEYSIEDTRFVFKKYIRYQPEWGRLNRHSAVFVDGTKAKDEKFYAFEVSPLNWKILNWDEMPKSINPKGNGKSVTMNLMLTNRIIITRGMNDAETYLLNLNGFVKIIKKDKDTGVVTTRDVTKPYSFFKNAFNIETKKLKLYSSKKDGLLSLEEKEEKMKKMRSKINKTFEDVPKTINIELAENDEQLEEKKTKIKKSFPTMSKNEQLQFYIQNGITVMLHGPSGVGKSRRVAEIDPDYVAITFSKNMLPENVKGKTIYSTNDASDAGRWVPPAWYEEICEKCKKEPNKNHVLFIDELLNGTENEQSLAYPIVLERSVSQNLGKLPDNVSIVLAGNSTAESSAATPMLEPLFRRVGAHMVLEPNLQEWIEWGEERKNDNPEQFKIHPIVRNFVIANPNFFYSKYDTENLQGGAIDPRGWEQVSDIIYNNNGLVSYDLVENKLGKVGATMFTNYAKEIKISLHDVINGNYDKKEIPNKFDAKCNLVSTLTKVSEEQVEVVRLFIFKELGREFVSYFDSLWVGEDKKRKQIVKKQEDDFSIFLK